jgi:O-antigen/teichoic acid export membrane protein
MYTYAFPIMIMGLAGVTNEMLSRAVLKKWLPPNFYPDYSNQAALGIFGAVYKLSIFMTLAIQAFRYAAEPFFFSRAKDKDSKELFSNVMHWFIIFSSFIFIIISLNLDVIGYLFLRNPTYREGLNIVPVLLLANLFYGIYYNLSVWFKLTDKTYYGTMISIFGAVVTILLNYLLIPILGYLGSSISSLVCYISMAGLSFTLGRKHYSVQYKTGRGLIYIVLSSLIILVGYYPHPSFSVTNKIIQFLMILIFGTVVWILEKDTIKTILHSFKSNNENTNHK